MLVSFLPTKKIINSYFQECMTTKVLSNKQVNRKLFWITISQKKALIRVTKCVPCTQSLVSQNAGILSFFYTLMNKAGINAIALLLYNEPIDSPTQRRGYF